MNIFILGEVVTIEPAINPFEILLFAVGLLFTFCLLGLFIFILTRNEAGHDDKFS